MTRVSWSRNQLPGYGGKSKDKLGESLVSQAHTDIPIGHLRFTCSQKSVLILTHVHEALENSENRV
jgi:hypothetical protein